MKIYTLFWLTGTSEIIKGNDPATAMNNAGYSNGALGALDFWSHGDCRNDYVWNKTEHEWHLTEEARIKKFGTL